MKKLLIAVSLALAACGPTTTTASTSSVSDTVTLEATDALRLAADAYTVAATAATVAIKAGALNDDQLRMVRSLNNQAIKLLEGGDVALTTAQKAASLALIVKQLRSIVGK